MWIIPRKKEGAASLGSAPALRVFIQGLLNAKCKSCPESMHLLLMALEVKSSLIHLVGKNHLLY